MDSFTIKAKLHKPDYSVLHSPSFEDSVVEIQHGNNNSLRRVKHSALSHIEIRCPEETNEEEEED